MSILPVCLTPDKYQFSSKFVDIEKSGKLEYHYEILKKEHHHLFHNPINTQYTNFRQNLQTLKNQLIIAAILGGHFEIFKNEHHHLVRHPINTQYTNFRQNLFKRLN